jgi:RNA polymerase subunit RPABC4/transcription elongation factor Spt4
MFCRNCGKELTGNPEFCMNCGARPMAGSSFCPNCGAPTTPMTEICPKCGARVAGKAAMTGGGWMPVTAGVLDLIVGVAALGGLATFFIGGLGALVGAPIIILSIIAIIGGVFAIRKRAWGFALAAAICGFIIGLPLFIAPAILLGIPAIVFTALGKEKFE